MNKSVLSAVLVLSALFVGSIANANDVRGDRVFEGHVFPGHVVTLSDLVLKADVETTIFVRGNGKGDIDCLLVDNDGNIVGMDADETDACYLEVTPDSVGEYHIRIMNNGKARSNFTVSVT